MNSYTFSGILPALLVVFGRLPAWRLRQLLAVCFSQRFSRAGRFFSFAKFFIQFFEFLCTGSQSLLPRSPLLLLTPSACSLHSREISRDKLPTRRRLSLGLLLLLCGLTVSTVLLLVLQITNNREKKSLR